ncbi:DNA-binding MarR family transcriptional regulator [Prauserella sediminis]|uniref:DNA-binding MarR family transcriptional regulator n=1 Tax=Prauserella sediminis TaxID=577680 RepID=A0A839XNX0_9PSEU|nr:MarR family transcriptional regulator [Prauserella sediminis]MBB3664441.1 DNA-binding MarR family transcriptional regulator [Prauserella sediminis]
MEDVTRLAEHLDAPDDGHDLLGGLDLDRHALPYLLRRAHSRAEALFVDLMCVDDLTPRQITLLTVSAQHPDATMSELAEAAAIDLNTASALIRKLLDNDLLERRRSPTDGRAWLISVTEAGADVLRQVLPHNRELRDAILAPLPPEYRPLFVKCLRMMLDIEPPTR